MLLQLIRVAIWQRDINEAQRINLLRSNILKLRRKSKLFEWYIYCYHMMLTRFYYPLFYHLPKCFPIYNAFHLFCSLAWLCQMGQ